MAPSTPTASQMTDSLTDLLTQTNRCVHVLVCVCLSYRQTGACVCASHTPSHPNTVIVIIAQSQSSRHSHNHQSTVTVITAQAVITVTVITAQSHSSQHSHSHHSTVTVITSQSQSLQHSCNQYSALQFAVDTSNYVLPLTRDQSHIHIKLRGCR